MLRWGMAKKRLGTTDLDDRWIYNFSDISIVGNRTLLRCANGSCDYLVEIFASLQHTYLKVLQGK
jgi:hypothetical protein